MKSRSFWMILIVLFLAILGFGCEKDTPKDEEKESFSIESLKPYEALVGASMKDVIAFLGEGEPQDFPGTIVGVDEPYSVMWQCNYSGSPFSAQGHTVVRYFLPSLEEISAGSDNTPRTVALFIINATLSTTEAKEILDVLFQELGNPNPIGKEKSFDKTQEYMVYWEKKAIRYTLTYDPPYTNEKDCRLTLFIDNPYNNK